MQLPVRIARRLADLALVLGLVSTVIAPARATTLTLVPEPTTGVLTLLVHQVSDTPVHSAMGEDNVKHPWLSPAQFDALLTLLESRGYTVVSLDTALGALGVGNAAAHATLPKKPVLLTFDDGYESAWTIATPILRKHRAVATMFFEGVATGKRIGRLTLADLRAMRASGVWTLESHGWMGHAPLQIAADGTRTPYWYANLAWRPADDRFETLDEFAARVRDDLRRFRTTFEPLLGVRTDVFAFPSGEFGQNGPLAPGGNALARIEAGHSNARGLEPIVLAALASEGYRAAFAVAVPGSVHVASPQDGPYTFPRIGVGADFDASVLDTIATDGIELPEIATNDTFADCMALASDDGALLTASSQQPELFRLTRDGRIAREVSVDALLADRAGHPALVSALVASGSDVTVVQQAGWWPGATAYTTRLHFDDRGASVAARTALPQRLHWPVGAIVRDGRIITMDDEGRFFDLDRASEPLFSVAIAAGESRHARFVGPALIGARLFVYDRTLGTLDELDPHGAVIGATPLGGDLRALGSDGGDLLVIDASAKRRIVHRFRLADA